MSSSNTQKQQPVNVLMCGPSGAGKTSIVHVIKHGTMCDAFATIGVDFQNVIIGTVTLRAWEYGGRERFRVINNSYYRNAKAFVFVVDSNDRERIDEAHKQLHGMKTEERFLDKPVLILANKQDLPDSMSIDELKIKLALDDFDKNIIWHLEATSAVQNKGIHEGFSWLANRFVTTTDLIKPIHETINDTIAMKNDFFSLFTMTNWKKLLNKFIDF